MLQNRKYSGSRSNSRPRSRSRTSARSTFCYYHQKFDSKAHHAHFQVKRNRNKKLHDMLPDLQGEPYSKTLNIARLYIKDKSTKISFLVDAGADISVIPPLLKLFAANGNEISTYGDKLLNLELGIRRNFLCHRLPEEQDHRFLQDHEVYYRKSSTKGAPVSSRRWGSWALKDFKEELLTVSKVNIVSIGHDTRRFKPELYQQPGLVGSVDQLI
uniref:Peptidase A2 domain-containing protein n=1 Tax=Megaselia scalaris TaxID=36166 RepID=T1GPF4_MEGSC